MLAALGRLYERSHLLLATEDVPLHSMSDVCTYLLSPFPWLEASLHKLVEEHGLRDVEAPKLKAALAMIESPQLPAEDFEPEPEPELPTAEEGVPPVDEPSAPELDAWLAKIDLDQYAPQIKEYGFHKFQVLLAATEADIVEMTEDADVKMKKPHRRLFVAKWQELVAEPEPEPEPA